jgi:leader peptidase (prepilin peptidase)/N-methyltransferase
MPFLLPIATFAILGAVLASFTAVVSERIYTGQSWFQGRSRCNSCRRQLTAVDLVPVFSWLVFRGRCRTCHARVPMLYTLFEGTLAFLFALSYLQFGLTLQLPVFLAALVVLGFIVLYDLRHMIVPLGSMLVLIVLAGIFVLMQMLSMKALIILFVTAFGIGLAFFLLYFFSKGRAMGLGDAPVAFALSLLVGSQAFVGLLFSFWVGAVIGIVILVLRRRGSRMSSEVPFVPFLAIGYLLAFFTQWNPFIF